jgi:hypothetical protein
LATEHNCEHVETSAKTSCNVEHAFALLVRGILAQLEKDVQIEVGTDWAVYAQLYSLASVA